jgi:hypothetical protein
MRHWSLDILLAENEPIPKGLYHSAQGCERRATLGAHGEMNRLPCKGCITAPTDAFSTRYEVAYDERYVWD